MKVFYVFNSENEKKCTLDQAFRGVLEEEIVSISPLYLLKFAGQFISSVIKIFFIIRMYI